MNFMCEALLDQNRYIGDDPVGRSCGTVGVTYLLQSGFRVCAKCYKLLLTEPQRVTFNNVTPPTDEQRIESFEQIKADVLKVAMRGLNENPT